MNTKECLSTSRLTIRRVTEGDWQSLQAIWADMNRSSYAQYDVPHNTDEDQVRARVDRWAQANRGNDHIFFAVCLEQIVIGYVAFNIRPAGYEIGYGFHSRYHGKGYARESMTALLGYMKALGAEKITAGTALSNTPSVRLLAALGFRQAGTEQVSFYKDEAGNDIVFTGGIFEIML